MGTSKKAITCEEAELLINGNLDNDLLEQERCLLSGHIERCHKCQSYLKESVDMESKLSDINQIFKLQRLDDRFNKKVLDAIKRDSQDLSYPQSETFLNFKLGILSTIKKFRIVPAICGGFASFLFFIFLWPGYFPQTVPQLDRFSLQEIPFYSAQENLKWNHKQIILPGYGAKFVVQKEDNHSFHFRLASPTPVNIKVGHKHPHSNSLPPRKIVLQGIRYGTLKTPRISDTIDIINEGRRPIQIDAYTQNPGAFRIKLVKFSGN